MTLRGVSKDSGKRKGIYEAHSLHKMRGLLHKDEAHEQGRHCHALTEELTKMVQNLNFIEPRSARVELRNFPVMNLCEGRTENI